MRWPGLFVPERIDHGLVEQGDDPASAGSETAARQEAEDRQEAEAEGQVMEKLTIQLFAVYHGDSDVISDSETLGAETKKELGDKLLEFLDDLREVFKEGMGR